MIVRASIVVTMDGAPIDNGAVAVSGNRIVDVGRFDEVKTRNTGETVDLGEQLLLPGLINAHCHLDYTCLREEIPPQQSFTDWIRAINAEKSELSPKDYVTSINQGFREAKRFGTTAIANLTAFPELICQVDSRVRTCWFAELIDVRASNRANELVDAAIEALKSCREGADATALSTRRQVAALRPSPWGLAPHALFTASSNLFRRCEEVAQREDILLTTHLAESREEMEMFRHSSGPLYQFIKSIGRPMDDCDGKTPLEIFVSAVGDRALSRWIIVHLNEVTQSDFDLLQESRSKFHVVHCPRSHRYFRHRPFPFDRLRSLGFNICLGTDSLASNETLSLFAEMQAFRNHFPGVSAEEILQMATVNSARALRSENSLGRIRPGFRADLIAIPRSGSRDIFEQIIAYEQHVNWVITSND